MARLFFFSYLFLCCCGNLYSQNAPYRKMLHKPYSQRAWAIDSLFLRILSMKEDSVYVNRFTSNMKEFALENGDKDLAMMAEFLRARYYLVNHAHTDPAKKKYMLGLAQKAKREKAIHIETWATNVVSEYYWHEKKYEKAFDWMLRSTRLLKKMTPEEFPVMGLHLIYNGLCYYFFQDYEKAVPYFKKASRIPKTTSNARMVNEALNNLGLCYRKLGLLRRSDSCFLAIINDKSKYALQIWQNIASGNLGHNYFLREEYDKAIPLLKTDLKGALEIKDYGLAAGASTPLAKIYLEQGKPARSKIRMDEARQYIDISGQHDRLRKLYPVMAKWNMAKGQPGLSAAYMDSALTALEQYNKKYSGLKLMRANKKAQERQKQLELTRLVAHSRLKISQRNFWILIIGILLMGTVLAFLARNKYLLKKQEAKELVFQNSQKSLAHAKNHLNRLIGRIRDDQQIISRFQEENNTKENHDLLGQLRAKNILTREDWNEFKKTFNAVFPGFIPKLKKSHPGLTPAETRCLCLIKLELSNNEMALVLGVSPNTVIQTKSRVRKKLDLENLSAGKTGEAGLKKHIHGL